MTSNKEIEVRENLQITSHASAIYRENFERIHDDRINELYSDLLQEVASGGSDEKIIRAAYRLEAMASVNSGFDILAKQEDKLTKKLKGITDDERTRRERDDFNHYNGS